MARHSFDRKSLKHDEFQDRMFWMVDWAHKRLRLLITITVVVVAMGLAGLGYQQYGASQRYAQALSYFQVQQGLEALQGDDSLRLAAERAAYQGFLDTYPDSPLAPAAMLHLARIGWLRDDLDSAAEAYTKLLAHSAASETQRDLARLGQAKLAEQRGDLDASRSAAESLTSSALDALQAFTLGRLAAKAGRNDEARGYFEQVTASIQQGDLSRWAQQHLDRLP